MLATYRIVMNQAKVRQGPFKTSVFLRFLSPFRFNFFLGEILLFSVCRNGEKKVK